MKWRIVGLFKVASFFLTLYFYSASAEVVVDANGAGYWFHTNNAKTKDEAFAMCMAFAKKYADNYSTDGVWCHYAGNNETAYQYQAGWFISQVKIPVEAHAGAFYINKCAAPSVYNVATGECGHDLQKGTPPINSCVADPINVAVGNSFQSESDLSLSGSVIRFTRYYNSLDGFWRHSYSTHLNIASGTLSVVRADGQELFYSFDSTDVTPLSGQSEILTHSNDGTWQFVDTTNAIFSFDATGKLVTQVDPAGRVSFLSRAGNITTVTDASGNQLTFTEDANFQPKTFGVRAIVGSYSYDNNGHLVDALVQGGETIKHRKYNYGDTTNNKLLTSVVDGHGVTLVSWSYDSQGRAVNNQLAGGAAATSVIYNTDGSATVTNPLAKVTTYKFITVADMQRTSAIIGEPSPNCPYSNTSYTYDSFGRMQTRTDPKGFITTYTYNDRGLEVSRTEASGTPQARVTTTEWDPTRFLRTKVVEPTRTTVYTYDDQGRETGRQVSAR